MVIWRRRGVHLLLLRTFDSAWFDNDTVMAASQLNPPYECGEGMKVKVVKWC